MQEYIALALRLSITYIYVLISLRLAGKRSIDTLSTFDLIVGLILGDLFDDIFWNDVPLSQGLVAITSVIFLHALTSYLTYKSTFLHHLVTDKERPVVRSSRTLKDNLAKERLSRDTVFSELRLHQQEKLEDVRISHLEPGGLISLIKKDEAQDAQKQDKPRLEKLFK